jgi:hypothetical protein
LFYISEKFSKRAFSLGDCFERFSKPSFDLGETFERFSFVIFALGETIERLSKPSPDLKACFESLSLSLSHFYFSFFSV